MIADVTREQWGWLRLELLVQDIRYALRQLRRTPGFAVTVLLTLALGIGANSAIFTLVNAILLGNLPVSDPKHVIRIGDQNDCCISDGWKETGDYSLFATDTYYMFCRNSNNWPQRHPSTAGGPLPSVAPDPTRWPSPWWGLSSPGTTSRCSDFRL
jgi:hypothetical protein